jgi:hypothetical protein
MLQISAAAASINLFFINKNQQRNDNPASLAAKAPDVTILPLFARRSTRNKVRTSGRQGDRKK